MMTTKYDPAAKLEAGRRLAAALGANWKANLQNETWLKLTDGEVELGVSCWDYNGSKWEISPDLPPAPDGRRQSYRDFIPYEQRNSGVMRAGFDRARLDTEAGARKVASEVTRKVLVPFRALLPTIRQRNGEEQRRQNMMIDVSRALAIYDGNPRTPEAREADLRRGATVYLRVADFDFELRASGSAMVRGYVDPAKLPALARALQQVMASE